MSETPRKLVEKRGRKSKEPSANDACRFCKSNLRAVCGTKPSFENLFKPSGRQGDQNQSLADACESIGFKLYRSETLSDRVCKPCGRKIRNAAELYKFVKSAVSSTTSQNQIDLESNVSNERSKRQLPSTVTPDRNEQKKLNKLERNPKSSRKSLFQQTSEQAASLQTQDNFLLSTENRESSANFLEHLPNIDPVDNIKPDTALQVIITYPNGNTARRETFDGTTKSMIKNLALKNWKSAANLVLKHPQVKPHVVQSLQRGISDEFKYLSKSETILKGREVDETIAYSNRLLNYEVSVLCPLWYACLKGACGKKKHILAQVCYRYKLLLFYYYY